VDVIAIVPARGGSKAIPRKNLHKLDGRSLTHRAIACGRAAGLRVLLTTDDEEIAAEGRRAGAEVPMLRPAELATDTARTVDAVLHILSAARVQPEAVCLLQPTTPLRLADDVRAAVALLDRHPNADGVASVARVDEPHPNKARAIRDGWLKPFIPGSAGDVPRQTLPLAYRLNGAVYVVRWDALWAERTMLPNQTLPYEMPAERSLNLDTRWDLYLLEALLARGEVRLETVSPP
jgi:CMP-N-acetylneuraminic acid synthetase